MWTKEFEKSIISSLYPFGKSKNNCFKAYYKQNPFFVKKFVKRIGETTKQLQRRIEQAEIINQHFHSSGISTILALNFADAYTHIIDDTIWVAYPWVFLEDFDSNSSNGYFAIGEFLKKVHNVSFNMQIDEKYNYHTADFSWSNSSSRDLEKFIFCFPKLRFLISTGELAIEQLSKIRSVIWSHRDYHPQNFFVHNNNLVLIDWELCGPSFPELDLLDTALNFCGFCEGKFDYHCFKSILQGYFYDNAIKIDIKLAYEILTLEIVTHLCALLNEYCKTNDKVHILLADEYLKQLEHLENERDFIITSIVPFSNGNNA